MLTFLLSVAFAGPHAQHDALFGGGHVVQVPMSAGPLPSTAAGGPDMVVYGYQAYWDDDLTRVPWADLTHIALFTASTDAQGHLYDTHRWDEVEAALALAEPYGVRVHLCVANFESSELATLLGSSEARSTLIGELGEWMALTGAHGINIDFEGVPAASRADMVTFTAELSAAVGEVVLATPAVDWSRAWDYAELSRYADLFIMGYGYHWSGSSQAGPTDPLFSGNGTPFPSDRSLSWTLDDYVALGADPARTILGLPLYGYAWDTASEAVPSTALASGEVRFWAEAQTHAVTHGRRWESGTMASWAWDGRQQTWVGDVVSLQARIAYVRDSSSIAGIGFWALHYDDNDPILWDMIRSETRFEEPSGTTSGTTPTAPTHTTVPTTSDTGAGGVESGPPGGPWVANAGPPFLAYVGDTVVLSGLASVVPAEGAVYQWSQLSGPRVTLQGRNGATPSFRVEDTGTHVFGLRVGDGQTWSEPAGSYVVVLDPAIGRRHGQPGCGCSSSPVSAWGALLVLVALRRRGHGRVTRH